MNINFGVNSRRLPPPRPLLHRRIPVPLLSPPSSAAHFCVVVCVYTLGDPDTTLKTRSSPRRVGFSHLNKTIASPFILYDNLCTYIQREIYIQMYTDIVARRGRIVILRDSVAVYLFISIFFLTCIYTKKKKKQRRRRAPFESQLKSYRSEFSFCSLFGHRFRLPRGRKLTRNRCGFSAPLTGTVLIFRPPPSFSQYYTPYSTETES